MGDTKTHVNATPDEVFAKLTKSVDDLEPGPIKVGAHFRTPGQNEVFTVTVVEPPSRFAYSVLTGDVTTIAEYTILPDGSGSIVRVEVDQSSPSTPLTAMILGGLLEGRTEGKLLRELKELVERPA